MTDHPTFKRAQYFAKYLAILSMDFPHLILNSVVGIYYKLYTMACSSKICQAMVFKITWPGIFLRTPWWIILFSKVSPFRKAATYRPCMI